MDGNLCYVTWYNALGKGKEKLCINEMAGRNAGHFIFCIRQRNIDDRINNMIE